eukprot:1383373-Pyramimonas_sp.AAC.1
MICALSLRPSCTFQSVRTAPVQTQGEEEKGIRETTDRAAGISPYRKQRVQIVPELYNSATAPDTFSRPTRSL